MTGVPAMDAGPPVEEGKEEAAEQQAEAKEA